MERGRCLKAWKAFCKVYKEECKAEGESKLSNFDMSEATKSAYDVFADSLDTLKARVNDLLECADRLSGVHLLAQISCHILCDEEGLNTLLEMREAVGAVVSTDTRVCEAKKAVELKIAQCQEELPKCLALLEQTKDKGLKERNTIKKPFKKLQESLKTDIQTLFEASDESLGVGVVRRVRGIKKTEFAHNYNQSGFKNALEKEVLKPLEEHFKALGLVVEPKRALDMLQAKMQENIATIPEALLELDKTYQELEKEGIVADKELSAIRKSVEPFLESFEESLQAFVKSTRDKAIIATGKRILEGLEEAGLSDLEKILPDLEAFMQVAGKSLHGSTASMDAEQMRAFVTERLHTELKRNNICEHLGNLEVGLKPLQEKAQELQTAIHQNKEDSITPYINGFQQAHQDTLKKLKHLLELLDHNTSKELTALSAELDALNKDLRFQREDYQQESSRQKDYQEDEDLEDTLKILKKAFRQGILKVLEALEAKMPKLHTVLENLKTSPFFKALIKPLWFYQGDNFKAYEDYLEASQKNNAQAYLELGKMFLKGVVVVKSLEKAREHFKKAATLGSIRAITQLGLSYVPENPKGMKEEDAKKATDYLKKALLLGDGMAEAGLKRLSYFDVIEWDGHRDGLIDLVSDVEAMLFSKEVKGERAYVCFFETYAHIDEHNGIDPEYREYSIRPFFEGDGFGDTGLFDEGFCATMQGHNARLHLSILKTIDVVYGKPARGDYEVAYSDAKKAYLKGIALGSGHCALELAHLELEQPKHFKMKPEKKQNALLEANHRAIGYFKQALEWGYNTAQVPLTNTLNRQHFLARASDHTLNAFLTKYESDLKEVASLTFTDKSMGFGGKLDVKAHLSPTFWQHPALKTLEVKTEQKPVSTLKPLWQYGNNTQQAFKDYMEAKKKGDARAWLYLGVMCLQGVVVPPDYYTAVACFEKARDLGELL
ncbi:tetratricopeptide repeat protein [Helicobacter bizzozeronii]|uniref:tetratricopeptide repeat protein n=1 Tax=Helicobacter bizzozeronii TaxID=56877 RepID=UPI0013155CD5|nr:tetratricopeptide repeat protein [Helicobacter bizzozeronii]